MGVSVLCACEMSENNMLFTRFELRKHISKVGLIFMDLFLLLFICVPTIEQRHTHKKKTHSKNANDSYYASNDSFIQRIGAVK